jgi:DNA-directed RNA polymerase subunit RPC12/RpoP
MAEIKYVCPYCKHEFYAEENAAVVCPACSREVKKDTSKPIF